MLKVRICMLLLIINIFKLIVLLVFFMIQCNSNFIIYGLPVIFFQKISV